MKKRNSIATRILSLFLLLGGLTITFVLATTFWFQQLAASIETVSARYVPTIATAASFAEIGGVITTDSTKLALATNQASRIAASQGLTQSLPKLERFSKSGILPERKNELALLKSAISHNIQALNDNTKRRLEIQGEQEQQRQLLHWLQVDFIDEISPLAKESEFNLNLLIQKLADNRLLDRDQVGELKSQSDIRNLLLTLEADINLVFDLLQRSTLFSSRSEVRTAQSLIDETFLSIDQHIARLAPIPSTVTVRQVADQLRAFTADKNGLIEKSMKAILLAETNLELLTENQSLIHRVKLIVTQAVTQAQHASEQSTQALTAAITDSRNTMTISVIIVLLLSLTVGWYLKSQLLNRLAAVLRTMRHLAAGEIQPPIPTKGNDEVALLAGATNVFSSNAQRLLNHTQQLEASNIQLKDEIEQRKRTEHVLRSTQDELVQAGKLATLGQLTAGIVHEFSQPLAAIKSNTYLANQYLINETWSAVSEKLDKVNKITDRATKLCQHLKSFSRQSNGALLAVNVYQVVEDAISLFEDRNAGHNWLINEVNQQHQALADNIRLEQVIVNLISNAIDAIKARQQQEEITPEISITCIQQDKQLRLAVKDNGCGLNPDHSKQIFEPFYTTKDVGQGLGLGMSISHNIIKDFGGKITLSSQPNQGTEVVLWLINPN